MADQFKLKTWVRIDGTGKVIPGGPIFQAHKPKVGKWREINTNLCCNEITSTTTSTSTSTSTTSTTTTVASFAFEAYPGISTGDACGHVNPMITVYANTTILGTLINLYMDAALTIPYSPLVNGAYLSIYFNAADQVCTMSGNMINSYTSCG